LFNELQEAGGQLIVAAGSAPRECGFELADLASRMSRLPVFQVRPLDEQQRAAALKLRARHRGLVLPDDTAAYLLKRSRRDMASLYELLDKLDLEALRAQRRLTIPFVRDVLQGGR
jgi:DnaA family protein